MDVTEEMIGRFFRNESTPAEATAVKTWLDSHPDEMEKYAVEMERFTTRDRLHPATSQTLFKKIGDNLGRKSKTRRAYRTLAIAASVLLVATALWLFVRQPAAHKEDISIARTASPSLVRVVNSSDTIMRLTLEDGSTVELAQQSGLSYYKPFINDRRDLSLKGTASFTVAKDEKRSFTVYAEGIATTALGTRFRVRAPGGKEPVTVQLYEGKVVVKQVDGDAMNYLAPGQQLVFNAITQKMTLTRNGEDAMAVKDVIATAKKNISPDLVFKDMPFEEVITRLEKEYKGEIRYDSAAVKKINVTAEFRHAETLFNILNTIATLNGLTVSQQGDTYTIR